MIAVLGIQPSDRHGRRPLPVRLPLWSCALAAVVCYSPAAAASPPDLLDLVQAADVSSVSASRDARLVAFRVDRPSVASNSYELRWHVLDAASGRVRDIGSAGEPILYDPGLLAAEPPIWSPDGRWIYYRGLRAGGVQVWRSAADGSGSQAVTAEEGDVLAIEPSVDGRGIAYRVGPPRREIEQAELAEYESGILVDEHVELGQNLFRGAFIHGRRASQRLAGTWFSRGHLLWARPPRERRLDFASLAAVDAGAGDFRAPTSEEAEAVARSSRGDVATAMWEGMDGSLAVTRAGRGGATVACPAPECRSERVSWVAWRPGFDQVVFASADRALVQTLRLWDLASGEVRTIVRGAGLLSGGEYDNKPCAVLENQAVCVAAGPTAPPRLEAIHLETGAARPLHDPNLPLRSRRWPAAKRLAWRSAEGKEFTAVLFLPQGAPDRPVPLFINYYRCAGFIRGGIGDEWPFAMLAASGIASVCVNTTRTTGPQDGVGQYRAALGGIEALVDLLARRGLVDRARVGMGGLSFGTEVTLWALIYSDLLSAASIASPQFEAASYWFNAVRGRDNHQILREVWGIGPPDETRERWKLVSAALNTDRIRAPLLLQLAEQESRYAIELYARLTNSPTPAEMYVFPDEPHIKVQPRHRLAVYRRNLDWFRFWLQGHEDPEPAKAKQYERWRALAERWRGKAGQDREERSQSSSETRSNSR